MKALERRLESLGRGREGAPLWAWAEQGSGRPASVAAACPVPLAAAVMLPTRNSPGIPCGWQGLSWSFDVCDTCVPVSQVRWVRVGGDQLRSLQLVT